MSSEGDIQWSFAGNGSSVEAGLKPFGTSQENGVLRVYPANVLTGNGSLFLCSDGNTMLNVTFDLRSNIFFLNPIPPSISVFDNRLTVCLVPDIPSAQVTMVNETNLVTGRDYFYCRVQTTRGTFRSRSVIVLPAPTFLYEPVNTTAQPVNGSASAAFSCAVSPADGLTEIQWYYQMMAIGSGSGIGPGLMSGLLTGTSILVLEEVGNNHEGFYSCVAVFSDGTTLTSSQASLTYNRTSLGNSDVIILAPPTDISVTEGDTVILPCVGSQGVSPSFLLGGVSQSTGPYSLDLPSISASSGGIYTCEIGETEANVTVNVVPLVRPSTDPVSVISGAPPYAQEIIPTATFTFFRCTRIPPGQWLRDGGLISNSNPNLRLSPNIPGIYQCVGVTPDQPETDYTGEFGSDFYLLVPAVVPPTITRSPNTPTFTFGDNIELTLNCSVSASPLPLLEWSRAGVSVEGAQAPTGFMETAHSILTINITELGVGSHVFQCDAMVDTELTAPISSVRTISITIQPLLNNISVAPVTQTVVLDDNPNTTVVVNCSVVANPPPRFQWTRNGVIVQGEEPTLKGEMEFSSSLSLTIGELGPGSHDITCSATPDIENPTDQLLTSATISVYTPPTFIVNPQSVTVIVGDLVSLNCSAQSTPLSNITWMYMLGNGTVVTIMDDVIFNISSSTEGDEGGVATSVLSFLANVSMAGTNVFFCVADNNIVRAPQSNALTVIVQSMPVFLDNPESTIAVVGVQITLNCSVEATPLIPTITWVDEVGEEIVNDGVFTISSFVPEASSSVNVSRLMFSATAAENRTGNGSAFQCVATVQVEEIDRNLTEQSEIAVITIADPDPPAPPTLLRVNLVTACTAEIIWDRNRNQPTTTAIPSYIIIEASLSMDPSAEWVHVGTANISDTSLTGRIPPGGLNTSYWLRARSGNRSVGEGENYLDPDTFYAYTEDMFPILSKVNGEPSSDSQTIRVQWSLLPQQDCFSPSFNIHCAPLEASSTSGQNRVTQDLTSALVRNLTSNTFYNCSVTVNFDGFDVSNKTYANNAIVTFPPRPSPPGVEPLGSVKPTSQTITVQFNLPLDHERISHYRVYAIRLSDRSLPSVNTNNLYKTPDDSRLSTYEAVNQPDPFDENTPPFLGYIAAEVGAEEFKPLFTIGDGSQTDVAEFPNKELRPSSLYTFFLRAYPKTRGDSPSRSKRQDDSPSRQYVVFSSSVFSNIFTTDEGRPDVGGNSPATQDIVIAVVVVVVLLLLIVGIIIVVLCLVTLRSARLRTYKPGRMPSVDNSPSSTCNGSVDFIIDTPDLARKTNGIHELKELDAQYFAKSPFVPSGPIKLEKFSEHVERFDSNRQLLFQEEYEWISSNSQWHAAEASNNILNDEKNRYSNITAFDHSRVELQLRDGIECSDYINANFISGYHSEQEYIATQGPLDQTVDDFWRMVWEQNTATIIMLTNLVELGKVKCAQYWPTCGKVIYDKLIVTLENTVNLPDYTIRNLSIDHMLTGESRTILQFHYTRWPDYHTPQLAAPLLNFLRAVNASNPEEVGPMVVHCSAGVGRSGTVIAIDYCLHKLREEKILDVCGFVSAMREQRNYMVQTAEQYTFIHYAILESNTYGDTSFSLSDFTSLYQKLREVNPESKKTQMDEEYSRLGQVKTMVKKSAFQRRLRRKGEPPRHFESSFRGTMPSVDSTDNYSGHFIDSYFEKKRFIVAEGPQESTSAKFWQVVWDEDCCMVVMLTPQDSPMFHRYWPAVGEQEQHGNVIVQVETETEEHFYTKREIKLTNAKVDGISHKLEQYQFMGWMEKDFPRVPDFVKFVCDVLECFRNIEGNKRVLMHDTDSLGPAVIMCALCYCIERLGVERMVDIFQAVQSIQLQRPGSIKTMKQYAFTYDCVYEYIRTYSSS